MTTSHSLFRLRGSGGEARVSRCVRFHAVSCMLDIKKSGKVSRGRGAMQRWQHMRALNLPQGGRGATRTKRLAAGVIRFTSGSEVENMRRILRTWLQDLVRA